MRRYEYTTSSVVKGDTRPQAERPDELVGADDPRLGQCRSHLEVGIRFDQRVEDVFEHLEREVCAGLVGVELIGFARDSGDEIS
jgi:hypothetical protein